MVFKKNFFFQLFFTFFFSHFTLPCLFPSFMLLFKPSFYAFFQRYFFRIFHFVSTLFFPNLSFCFNVIFSESFILFQRYFFRIFHFVSTLFHSFSPFSTFHLITLPLPVPARISMQCSTLPGFFPLSSASFLPFSILFFPTFFYFSFF